MNLKFTLTEYYKRFLNKKTTNYKFLSFFSSFLVSSYICWSQDFQQDHYENPLGIGVGIGTYMPTNSETKAFFGGNSLNFIITPMVSSKFNSKWVFGGDLDILARSYHDNRFLAVKLGLAASKQLGGEFSEIKPYVAFTAGPVYYDYIFHRLGQRISSKKIGVGGSVELGVKIQKRIVLNGRYCIYNSPDKLNLNGFSVNLIYKIL